MNHKKTLTLAAAALIGMLAGSAARAAVVPSHSGNSARMTTNAGQRAIALDAPATHDCKGQNSCKGQGGCKSGDNGCKGQNSCSGKGGCSTKSATTKPGL